MSVFRQLDVRAVDKFEEKMHVLFNSLLAIAILGCYVLLVKGLTKKFNSKLNFETLLVLSDDMILKKIKLRSPHD